MKRRPGWMGWVGVLAVGAGCSAASGGDPGADGGLLGSGDDAGSEAVDTGTHGGRHDGGSTRGDTGGNEFDSGASGDDAGGMDPTDTGGMDPTDTGGMDFTDTGTGTVDAGHTTGPCMATVPRGGENTDALCSNGIDDDCNGYIDCNDYHCSRNASVTVCAGGGGRDAGTRGTDAGAPTDAGFPPSDVPVTSGPIGPTGGSMSLLHFGAFGDCRPPVNNDTSGYPTAVVQSVFRGLESTGVPFVVGTGDYMFATYPSAVDAQLTMFLSAQALYSGYAFHTLGNHECDGQTASNCPNLNEYHNIVAFRARLQADLPNVYHDFVVHTSLGDAHFILVAPNAWTPTQATWLTNALNAPGMRYTFVAMHEPPSASGPPAGATAAERIIDAHMGVTLRIYGHTHEYRREGANAVITGNAGAPLQPGASYFGFLEVQQRSDGNIVVNEYQVGSPPMVVSSFVLTPTGAMTH